jgi:hypothetical protein
VSRNSHAVAALRDVVTDGTRLAAVLARRADLESRAPVRYFLTPKANAALTKPGGQPPGYPPGQSVADAERAAGRLPHLRLRRREGAGEETDQ